MLPDTSMRGNAALPQPAAQLRDHHCMIYVLTGYAKPCLLVSCQYNVTQERAVAVCRALMGDVCPETVRR